MSIQSNINQTWSLAAFLLTQSDAVKDWHAANRTQKQIGKLENIQKEAKKGVAQYVEGAGEEVPAAQVKEDVPELGIVAQTNSQIAEKTKSLAETKPTTKNIQKYIDAKEQAGPGSIVELYENPEEYVIGPRKNALYGYTKVQQTKNKANEALQVEAERIAATPSFDLDKLHPSARARVERAYKKAEHDTKYLNKKEAVK